MTTMLAVVCVLDLVIALYALYDGETAKRRLRALAEKEKDG